MFKTKRIPAIILLALLVIGMGSCGGGSSTEEGVVNKVTVRGWLIDENSNPISDATLTFQSNPVAATTNAEGYFEVDIEVGSHSLNVEKGGQSIFEGSVMVTDLCIIQIVAKNAGQYISFRWPDGYTIAGRVLYNGKGFGDVLMTLAGPASATALTDSSGNYSFTVSQNGSYTIVPGKTGYSFNPQYATANVSNSNAAVPDFIASQVTYSFSSPTNLTATAVSSSQINLTWSAPTGHFKAITGYKVYRNGIYVKQVSTTSTSDAGLAGNTQYCYRVSAMDSSGVESAQSTQACATTAQAGISFQDANLERCIRDTIGKPTGALTQSDVQGIIRVSCGSYSIQNLSGIQNLTALQRLDLYDNQISDVTPLSSLTALQGLDLENNRISNIAPLSSLTALQFLGLDDNQISNIAPLSSLTALQTLYLDGNCITDFTPVSFVPICSGCDIASQNPGCGEGVSIPTGCFTMGDAFSEGNSDELPVHEVCITGFYMDIHEVTNAEYKACVDAVVCTAPEITTSDTRASYYGNASYNNFPVTRIGWNGAVAYCAWKGKRLPTEAEWEYAARGGLSGKRHPWGDTITGADANYYNSGDVWDNDTSPVGSYAPNGYGLYDMAGNIMEWVNDWYDAGYYSISPTNDPQGPASGKYRGVRGGGYDDDCGTPFYLRVAHRQSDALPSGPYDIGFRCARN